MKRDCYIYKALTKEQWAVFQLNAVFTGSPVDIQDGYIHMSRAAQLKETLDKWYADQDQVALLQIKASVIESALKYELSRGGAEFPHLFADLPMSSVRKVWLVSPDRAVYSLPNDLTAN